MKRFRITLTAALGLFLVSCKLFQKENATLTQRHTEEGGNYRNIYNKTFSKFVTFTRFFPNSNRFVGFVTDKSEFGIVDIELQTETIFPHPVPEKPLLAEPMGGATIEFSDDKNLVFIGRLEVVSVFSLSEKNFLVDIPMPKPDVPDKEFGDGFADSIFHFKKNDQSFLFLYNPIHRSVALWDFNKAAFVKTKSFPDLGPAQVQFDRKNQRILLVAFHKVLVLDANTFELVATLAPIGTFHESTTIQAFSLATDRAARRLAFYVIDGKLQAVDIDANRKIFEVTSFFGIEPLLRFSESSQKILSLDPTGSVEFDLIAGVRSNQRQLLLTSGEPTLPFDTRHAWEYSADGRFIVLPEFLLDSSSRITVWEQRDSL